MKKTLISVLVILICLEIRADIGPDPIQAKGISVNLPTDIKMTYEKVIINLSLDSSFVHCYFRLRNEGDARKIQIGYPNMSYYTITKMRQLNYNPVTVFDNGKKISNINFFMPDSLNLYNNDNYNKPWYLWDTYFELNETKVIDVSYSLPRGKVKNDLYSTFDYLLSTGAGWKGNIDTAEIIINLKNFDKSLLLKTLPGNYIASDNQIIWKLYNFEPTLDDNISIKYEREKGQYEERLKQVHLPALLLDETISMSHDIRSDNSIGNLNPNEIASLEIIKSNEAARLRFPNIDCSNGLILCYSKRFAIDKLIEIIKAKSSDLANDIKYNTISDFEENYSLVLNDKIIKRTEMTGEFMKLDKDLIKSISIKKLENNQKEINIKLNK